MNASKYYYFSPPLCRSRWRPGGRRAPPSTPPPRRSRWPPPPAASIRAAAAAHGRAEVGPARSPSPSLLSPISFLLPPLGPRRLFVAAGRRGRSRPAPRRIRAPHGRILRRAWVWAPDLPPPVGPPPSGLGPCRAAAASVAVRAAPLPPGALGARPGARVRAAVAVSPWPWPWPRRSWCPPSGGAVPGRSAAVRAGSDAWGRRPRGGGGCWPPAFPAGRGPGPHRRLLLRWPGGVAAPPPPLPRGRGPLASPRRLVAGGSWLPPPLRLSVAPLAQGCPPLPSLPRVARGAWPRRRRLVWLGRGVCCHRICVGIRVKAKALVRMGR